MLSFFRLQVIEYFLDDHRVFNAGGDVDVEYPPQSSGPGYCHGWHVCRFCRSKNRSWTHAVPWECDRHGLLQIPEEGSECPLLVDLQGMPMTDALMPRSAFIHAVLDPVLKNLHCAMARNRERGPFQSRLELLRTRCLEQGPESLAEQEISLLVKDKESLAWLHREAWRADDDSVWGRLIHTL